jgi:hypothetical protein
LTHGGLLPTWHPKGSAATRNAPASFAIVDLGVFGAQHGSGELAGQMRLAACSGSPSFCWEYEVMVQPRLVVK